MVSHFRFKMGLDLTTQERSSRTRRQLRSRPPAAAEAICVPALFVPEHRPQASIIRVSAVEPAEPPQLWRRERDSCNHDERAHAAADHRKYRAEQGRDASGLETPELIRRADEHSVDRRNPAAHLVGGEDRRQRMTNDDADVIERAGQEQHRQREPEIS
jgi:hypothetical protein